MKALRHPVTLAFLTEGLLLLLTYLFPLDWAEGFISSPRFWIFSPHFPALILSGAVLHPESETAKALALVVPTLVLWNLLFYLVRLAWKRWPKRHERG